MRIVLTPPSLAIALAIVFLQAVHSTPDIEAIYFVSSAANTSTDPIIKMQESKSMIDLVSFKKSISNN
jgi:hypothetical protein